MLLDVITYKIIWHSHVATTLHKINNIIKIIIKVNMIIAKICIT